MRSLTIPLLAVFALVLSTDRAHACRCIDPGLATAMKNATMVFVGSVTSIEGKPKLHTIAVEGVWKGAPGKSIVSTGSGMGDCSYGGSLGKGTRWLIFLRQWAAVHPRPLLGQSAAQPPRDRTDDEEVRRTEGAVITSDRGISSV